KSVITSVAIIAVSLCPGAASARAQQPPEAPTAPVAPAPPPQEEELARVQEQVKREIAQAQQAAPAAPAALGDVPMFHERLHQIVRRGGGGSGRTLVIRSSDTDAKVQANLEEDMAVMSRILDKTLDEKLGGNQSSRTAMGIDVLIAPGGNPVRSLFLEGYGTVFILNVRLPLLPPPVKATEKTEKPHEDTAWDEARRELYGQHNDGGEFGKAIQAYTEAYGRFGWESRPTQAYDENKVSELKDALLQALKNATNIRHLPSDEFVTVCLFGPGSASTAKLKVVQGIKKAGDDPNATVVPDERTQSTIVMDKGTVDSDRPHGTIMTIRVKKADVDAFAKGKLDLDDFRKKAGITTYTGDTGGWGGGNFFGIAAP
ncbi:MAG TPA: hypothetical protein VN887_12640, partial [Candidatus Angelobacter sp.]|nr:hypothetical protein [Candidatus Angelobacter sp.]